MIARERLSLFLRSTGVFPHLVEQRLDDHRTEVLHEGGDRLKARRRSLAGSPDAVLEAWDNAADELRRMAAEGHDGNPSAIEGALQLFRRANADGRLHRINERGEILGELFAGELDALKALRTQLRAAVQHGTLDDVRRLLAVHEAEERTGLALQQKRDGCTGRPGCECPWCGGESAGSDVERCGSQCPRHLQHTCRRSPVHQPGICRDAKQKGTETCTWDPADPEGGDV